MIRRFFGIVALLMLLVGAHEARAADPDGNTWGHLNESEKANYVAGFLDGFLHGQMEYTGALLSAMADPKTGKFDAKRADVAKSAGARGSEVLARDLGNGQLDSLSQGWTRYTPIIETRAFRLAV